MTSDEKVKLSQITECLLNIKKSVLIRKNLAVNIDSIYN